MNQTETEFVVSANTETRNAQPESETIEIQLASSTESPAVSKPPSQVGFLRFFSSVFHSLNKRQQRFVLIEQLLIAAVIEFGITFGTNNAIYQNANSGVTLFSKPFGLFYDFLIFGINSTCLTFLLETRAMERALNAKLLPSLESTPFQLEEMPRFLRWVVDVHPSPEKSTTRYYLQLMQRGFAWFWMITFPPIMLIVFVLMAVGNAPNPVFPKWPLPSIVGGFAVVVVKLTTAPLFAMLGFVRMALRQTQLPVVSS
ncbi:hypothetical protein HK100_008547 [Physocladia obscura]|uniref:Uncharacterized protein n=1 Tax=Physocladia obscura TaxID=109957 RepID=A0AAD5T402_9FUNG|nr:hypothetical protein HK100_008547 [Physocladia obscura]